MISCSKYYNSIDLFKFIMSIVVVAIHTQPLINNTNQYVDSFFYLISELTVPFFFITTGFFIGKQSGYPSDIDNFEFALKKSLCKTIKLYILWTIIYFPLAFIRAISINQSLIKFLIIYIRGFLLIGENYNSWMLWYLLSTIYGLLTIMLLIKKTRNLKIILPIGLLIITIGFMLDIFIFSDNEISGILLFLKNIVNLSISSGRIFRGVGYLVIGIVFSCKKDLSCISYLLILISSFVIGFFTKGTIICKFSTLLSSIGLFGIIKNIKIINFSNSVSLFLRKMSINTYFLHMYVWTIYYYLFYGKKTYGVDSFFVTVISCIIITLIITLSKNFMKKVDRQ